ncbi:MAG: transglycosylase domain-containing protein [Oscillospiraceae bacterium]|nr:transglycosylase domain-containing protein [Oscillospiraceae bacterium]
MVKVKAFFHKIKCFFLAFWTSLKKGANKIFSPEIKPEVRRVRRAFIAVLGVISRVMLIMLMIVLLTSAIIGVFGAIYVTKYLNVNTDIDFDQFDLAQTSHIWAADPDNPGEYILLESLSGKENRVWISYDEMPKNIIDAAVAIEDKRFWDHEGVDWRRTVGAFLSLLSGDSSFGGSTITQQMLKNNTGDDDPTVSRKIQEIFRALALEKSYPGVEGKESILEMYLNTVYFGRGCYGILTASELYFGKPLEELSLAECAAIVGITNNPSYYDPYSNPKNNKNRQETILGEMFKQKMIKQHEYNLAKYQPLEFKQRENTISGESIRSWYVDQIIRDVTADLMKEHNMNSELAKRWLFSGGLDIYACVDLNIQKAMDDIWADDSCWPNTPDAEPPEAAMMLVDQATGEIKAMIGGREKTGNLIFDRSIMAERSPGSAIKPITVYAPAFDLGMMTPYSPVDDIPVRKEGNRGWPLNSPNRWIGHMTVLQAVTESKNTVAVSIVDRVGTFTCFTYGFDRFGLTTMTTSKTVGNKVFNDVDLSPLGMGSLTGGATVHDMTGAYAAIANKGMRNKLRTYTHVIDQSGVVILENKPDPKIAIKEKTAYYLETCMINVIYGTGGTGSYAKVNNMQTAGKTGTTSANKDRWFAGYTPYYTAVTWFGYDIGRDMSYYNNNRPGNPALHMWIQVMNKAHEGLEPRQFTQPEGIQQFQYCIDSGMTPGEYCRLDPRGNRTAVGYLDKDDIPRTTCTMHKPVSVCILTNNLATPNCPAETCKTAALLDLERWVPIAGFALSDEQYTMRRLPGTAPDDGGEAVPAAGTDEERYRIIAEGTDGRKPYNSFCEFNHPISQPPDDGGEDPGGDPSGGEDDPSGGGEDPALPPEEPENPEP